MTATIAHSATGRQTVDPRATALAAMALLLEYPTPAVLGHALFCREALEERFPEAAHELSAFVAWAANEPPEAVEETFTRTFYIAPVCVPYVGIHLFGEESFQRGAFMARLLDAFAERGFSAAPELPDHVTALLRFAHLLDSAELEDLVDYCLREPVERMAAKLAKTTNPYRHVLAALAAVLGARGAQGALQ